MSGPGGTWTGPEGRALLSAAAGRRGSRPGPEGGPQPDWPVLLGMAARHGLLTRLRRLLLDAGTDLPRQSFVDLWAHHERLARRNAVLWAALGEVLEALARAGLPALPFKGPVLALQAYGDLAAREFADLDLLVRPRDLAAARAVLEGLGYVPECALAPAQEAAMLRARTQYHLLLVHPEKGVAVELHWKSDPDHPVEEDTEAWWAARPRTPIEGREVLAFTQPELVLVLCIHGSKHHWSRLAWLADVAALLGKDEALDWAWIRARAAQLGASRRLALGLLLLADLLGAPVPEDQAAWARSLPAVRRQAATLTAHLFDPEPWTPGPWSRLGLDLAQREGPSAKLRCAWDVLFAPSHEEWMRWRLRGGLQILYPALRVVRLLRKHSGGGQDGTRNTRGRILA